MDRPLRPAEEVRTQALDILASQRARLAGLGVPGELVLVGGSSVPGVLTRGDVDLHLRVPPPRFEAAVALLRGVLRVVHAEIWGPTLATFDVPAPLPTGLAATPVGSEHDLRFTRCWQLLGADPALVEAYNAAKLAEPGAGAEAYEARKSAFFDRLVALWPEHPAGGQTSRRT